MRVRMLSTIEHKDHGKTYKAGKEYVLDDDLADVYLRGGFAEAARSASAVARHALAEAAGK